METPENARKVPDKRDNGPGPWPHTLPWRNLNEDMWSGPIKEPAIHAYGGHLVLPHHQAKDWQTVSEAIQLSNLRAPAYVQGWWEPPITMGFEHRAKHNQPGQKVRLSSEWDWIEAPKDYCDYCGDDGHKIHECGLHQLKQDFNEVSCLNCNGASHTLAQCISPPQFDDSMSRAEKLVKYTKTDHFRKALYGQHVALARLAGREGQVPALHHDKGNAALAFTWCNCPDCSPDKHETTLHNFIDRVIQQWLDEDVQTIVHQSEKKGKPVSDEKLNKLQECLRMSFDLVIDVSFCPVIWRVAHKQRPDRVGIVINPMESVAVDTLWRTSLAAMGWLAPALPDVSAFADGYRVPCEP